MSRTILALVVLVSSPFTAITDLQLRQMSMDYGRRFRAKAISSTRSIRSDSTQAARTNSGTNGPAGSTRKRLRWLGRAMY